MSHHSGRISPIHAIFVATALALSQTVCGDDINDAAVNRSTPGDAALESLRLLLRNPQLHADISSTDGFENRSKARIRVIEFARSPEAVSGEVLDLLAQVGAEWLRGRDVHSRDDGMELFSVQTHGTRSPGLSGRWRTVEADLRGIAKNDYHAQRMNAVEILAVSGDAGLAREIKLIFDQWKRDAPEYPLGLVKNHMVGAFHELMRHTDDARTVAEIIATVLEETPELDEGAQRALVSTISLRVNDNVMWLYLGRIGAISKSEKVRSDIASTMQRMIVAIVRGENSQRALAEAKSAHIPEK